MIVPLSPQSFYSPLLKHSILQAGRELPLGKAWARMLGDRDAQRLEGQDVQQLGDLEGGMFGGQDDQGSG